MILLFDETGPCEIYDLCDWCSVTRGSNIPDDEPFRTVIKKKFIKERREFFLNNRAVENKYKLSYCSERYQLEIEEDAGKVLFYF
jgi:hypothetical protein